MLHFLQKSLIKKICVVYLKWKRIENETENWLIYSIFGQDPFESENSTGFSRFQVSLICQPSLYKNNRLKCAILWFSGCGTGGIFFRFASERRILLSRASSTPIVYMCAVPTWKRCSRAPPCLAGARHFLPFHKAQQVITINLPKCQKTWLATFYLRSKHTLAGLQTRRHLVISLSVPPARHELKVSAAAASRCAHTHTYYCGVLDFFLRTSSPLG